MMTLQKNICWFCIFLQFLLSCNTSLHCLAIRSTTLLFWFTHIARFSATTNVCVSSNLMRFFFFLCNRLICKQAPLQWLKSDNTLGWSAQLSSGGWGVSLSCSSRWNRRKRFSVKIIVSVLAPAPLWQFLVHCSQWCRFHPVNRIYSERALAKRLFTTCWTEQSVPETCLYTHTGALIR